MMVEIANWLTTAEAAEISKYHVEYIRLLIRSKEIYARKWGRDWMVNRKSLLEYMKHREMQGKRRGPKTANQ